MTLISQDEIEKTESIKRDFRSHKFIPHSDVLHHFPVLP